MKVLSRSDKEIFLVDNAMRYAATYLIRNKALYYWDNIPANRASGIGMAYHWDTHLSPAEKEEVQTARQIWMCDKDKALKNEYVETVKKSYDIFLELKEIRKGGK